MYIVICFNNEMFSCFIGQWLCCATETLRHKSHGKIFFEELNAELPVSELNTVLPVSELNAELPVDCCFGSYSIP